MPDKSLISSKAQRITFTLTFAESGEMSLVVNQQMELLRLARVDIELLGEEMVSRMIGRHVLAAFQMVPLG